MPDFKQFRRAATAATVIVLSAGLTLFTAVVASASEIDADAGASATSTSGLLWGIPFGMTLWGVGGLVAVLLGLFLAAKPARRFKAAAEDVGGDRPRSAKAPEQSTAATAV